jgi:hypothetical protein
MMAVTVKVDGKVVFKTNSLATEVKNRNRKSQ